MSSGNGGIKSEFYNSYSFEVNYADGMMLGSVLSNTASNSETLILKNMNDISNVSRSGANVRYIYPGNAFSYANSDYKNFVYLKGQSYMYGYSQENVNGFKGLLSVISGEAIDIYNYSNPGVYLLRLSGDNAVETRPIFSSTAFTGFFSPGINYYNAVIIYPGWGFRLFNGPSTWSSTFTSVVWNEVSYIYFNDTTEPLFFTCATDFCSNSKNFGRSNESPGPSRGLPNTFVSIPIMTQVRNNAATSNNFNNRSFPDYAEDGIQIFYRSSEPLFRFGLS